MPLANIPHAYGKQVHLNLGDFFLHYILVKTLVDFHEKGCSFLVDLGVPHLQHNLYQRFYPNELDIENLQLSLKSGHYLPILLIDVDKEGLEAGVNRLREESKIEFEQRIEEDQLKAVV